MLLFYCTATCYLRQVYRSPESSPFRRHSSRPDASPQSASSDCRSDLYPDPDQSHLADWSHRRPRHLLERKLCSADNDEDDEYDDEEVDERGDDPKVWKNNGALLASSERREANLSTLHDNKAHSDSFGCADDDPDDLTFASAVNKKLVVGKSASQAEDRRSASGDDGGRGTDESDIGTKMVPANGKPMSRLEAALRRAEEAQERRRQVIT
ncbi:unnamed protein product [Protopolystoma xenopodis]|uniref:Uncharacterized protein n=1 Tax=Protopolystoma xenopodis TaxID=117903 RepID=A0A448WSB8_9PLAT|nr:unnamed protein product [Protopolystoma xenopodis]